MTRYDPRFDFAQLKARVSIASILAAYGLDAALRRVGDHLVGPCPVHGGDNPTAFRVHLGRGLWHCHTSCAGGDVVDLVRAIERCSFAQAARSLARIAEHKGPRPPAPPLQPAPTPPFRPFTRTITLDPRNPFLQHRKRIAVPTAQRFEAGVAPRSHLLRGTVAVRLHDLAGRPLGYCGRRLDPSDAHRWGKWRFPRGLPKHQLLNNAHRATPVLNRGLVITECCWSVMRLHQAGVPAAVALLGTNLSADQATWIAQANDVLLLLDGDHTGRTAARTIAAKLAATPLRVHIHLLPEGLDPDDLPDDLLRSLVSSYLPFSLHPYEPPRPPR